MCLIAWNWQPESSHPLLLIANRDEYYARPTSPLHCWTDTDILAGRDLQAGGTWLGVSRTGRLAALTNHRDPLTSRVNAPSRGELVSAFLHSEVSATDYLTALLEHAPEYNPFNLLVYDGLTLMGFESRHARIIAVPPGVGAVSNADFQSPWPKLASLKSQLQRLVDQGQPSSSVLLSLLQSPELANDAELPNTGVTLEIERALSAIFVNTPDYGTRASSVVRFESGHISFIEQAFDANGPLRMLRLGLDLHRR